MQEEISFGVWLRKHRRALDLSRQAFADQVGCAEVTLRRIEAGTLKPSKQLASVLLEKLGIPEAELSPWVAFARGLSGLPLGSTPLSKKQITNLPSPLTSFIGREKQQLEIIQLISKHRLVTLTGAGGVGKTRLSLQVATLLPEQFPDGIWFIELAPVADPGLIQQTILTTLGLSDRSGQSILQLLSDFLQEKTLLLLLDNCEHLIEASAQVTTALLNAAPELKVLASSREALGVKGELSYLVPSLALPDPKYLPGIDPLAQCEAVQLLIDRARLAAPHFELDQDNAPFVVQICSRLDGIPLAIELAAARVKVLSPEQIAGRLDDRFRLLTGGARAALPRHQTLRATIDWSYNLLSQPEKILFRRLAVFAGGWSLEAVERVCSGEGIEAEQVLDLMSNLVNKSLVIAEIVRGESRYRMLETIRQYASEQLSESAEVGTLRNQHLAFYMTLAEELEPKLKTAERIVRKKQLELEEDNFRAALAWSLAEAKNPDAEKGVRLACSLTRLWDNLGHYGEGRAWLERGLALLADGGFSASSLYARALSSAGYLAIYQGDYGSGHRLIEECLALYQKMGPLDPRGLANALKLLAVAVETDRPLARSLSDESVALCRALGSERIWDLADALLLNGHFAILQRDYETARSRAEESRLLFQRSGNVWDAAGSICMLGDIALFSDKDYTAARAYYEESLRLGREIADAYGNAYFMNRLAAIDYCLGNYEAASRRYQEGLKMWQDMGNKIDLSLNLLTLGITVLQLGDYERARMLLKESLPLLALESVDWGDPFHIAMNLAGFSELARRQKHLIRAARLLGAAEAITASMRDHFGTVWVTHRDIYESLIDAGHEQLDQAAWHEGQAMSVQQAVEYALTDRDE